jgi:hypothetical protein
MGARLDRCKGKSANCVGELDEGDIRRRETPAHDISYANCLRHNRASVFGALAGPVTERTSALCLLTPAVIGAAQSRPKMQSGRTCPKPRLRVRSRADTPAPLFPHRLCCRANPWRALS